jgi:hypothetical protein
MLHPITSFICHGHYRFFSIDSGFKWNTSIQWKPFTPSVIYLHILSTHIVSVLRVFLSSKTTQLGDHRRLFKYLIFETTGYLNVLRNFIAISNGMIREYQLTFHSFAKCEITRTNQIKKNSLKHKQQDATLYNILYYCQRSTCFKRFLRPLSGAQNCTYSVGYLSNLVASSSSNQDGQILTNFKCAYSIINC